MPVKSGGGFRGSGVADWLVSWQIEEVKSQMAAQHQALQEEKENDIQQVGLELLFFFSHIAREISHFGGP